MKANKGPSDRPKKPEASAHGTISQLPRLNRDEDEPGAESSGTTETNLSIAKPRADAPRIALTMVTGAEEGRVFPINLRETWIGRADDCTIVITDRDVSRRHVCIVQEDASIFVKDNDTKNGTFVNNRRVSKFELQPGDEIQLGPNVCFVFSHETRGHRRAAREKAIEARLHNEKLESIRSMVAGVAHEINTPLGVANAATAMMESLADEVRRNPNGERLLELLADLKASTGLVSKNLERASHLVRQFKQLSSRESSDEPGECDLADIAQDAVDLTHGEARANNVTVELGWGTGPRFPWLGYQDGMTRVLVELIQNSIRHGYPDRKGGVVSIHITKLRRNYHIAVEDVGAGMDPSIIARVFEPFVMAERDKGGTGLGLAIVHQFVTNVFGGAITFTSQRGKGTRFLLKVPTEVAADTNG